MHYAAGGIESRGITKKKGSEENKLAVFLYFFCIIVVFGEFIFDDDAAKSIYT